MQSCWVRVPGSQRRHSAYTKDNGSLRVSWATSQGYTLWQGPQTPMGLNLRPNFFANQFVQLSPREKAVLKCKSDSGGTGSSIHAPADVQTLGTFSSSDPVVRASPLVSVQPPSWCWVELGPPKRYVGVLTLVPANATLLRNRVFADVIKLKWSHAGLRWDLIQRLHPYKKREIEVQLRRECHVTGRGRG